MQTHLEHRRKEGKSLGWSLPALFSCASKTHCLEFGHARYLSVVFCFHGLTATKELGKKTGFWGGSFVTVIAVANLSSIEFFSLVLNRRQSRSISEQWNIGLLLSACSNFVLTSLRGRPRGLV